MSSQQLQYKPFLEKIIEEWTKDNKMDVSQTIMQTVFESLLKAEQANFLEYEHSEENISNNNNKRNGYYLRLLNSLSGKYELKIPRDRQGRFKPMLLEIMKRQRERVDELAYSLYTKGLSTRDVADVLKEIYSAETAPSPQYISNITTSFLDARKQWQERKLDESYYVVYIDAIHMPIRRATVDNEAIYVVIGLKKDFTREILGIYSIPQESASGWKEVLDDLKKRRVKNVLLFVADGLTGLETQIQKVYPKSYFQKCVVHFKRNILKKVRHTDKKEVAEDLKNIFKIDDKKDKKEYADERVEKFLEKWKKSYPNLKRSFDENILDYYFTYLDFPVEARRMIYTTNWIERLNKSIRKVTKNRNSFPNEDSALTLIWSKLLEVEEKTYKYPITKFYSCEKELSAMLQK